MEPAGLGAEEDDRLVADPALERGAADLVAGNALQSPAWDTQQVNLAVAANAAIGATTVTVTNGTTAITLNQYAGGLLVVETTPGEGYSYRIAGNSAAANGATITLTIEQPGLIVALTAAGSKVSMALNPYSGVIQAHLLRSFAKVASDAAGHFSQPAFPHFSGPSRKTRAWGESCPCSRITLS